MQSISQERSDSISPLPLVLPDTDYLFNRLKNIPKGRIIFVTIRDPHQKYNMNKAINWIKKNVDTYCVVKGTAGGEHYHLLASISKGSTWVPRCSKGIHFNIQYLNTKEKPLFFPESDDDRRDRYLAEVITNNLVIKYKVPDVCVQLSKMVRNYFTRTTRRAKALVARTEKELHLTRVISYLEQNLNENDEIIPYKTYHYWQRP
jgi:hypothetical protein